MTIDLRLQRGEGTCAQISGENPGLFEKDIKWSEEGWVRQEARRGTEH